MSLENTQLYRDVAASEAKFRELVDSNIVGIGIWELDGRIVEANEAFLRIVGYERDDLVSGRLRWIDFALPRYLDRDLQELAAQVRSCGSVQPFEWEFFRKNGSRVPVLIGAALLESKSQGVGFVLDLTERKRAEHALKQSEAYLAETQRLTHTGSWAYNHVRKECTYYSDEQFRVYGFDPGNGRPSAEEILGRVHPEDRQRMLDLFWRIIREKSGYTADYRIVLPGGAVRHLQSIGHPILDERGELLEHFGTVVDVTERRRVEQHLLAQNRITRVLCEASSLEEAVPEILQAVCESLGWHVGVLWRVDRDAGVLRCSDLWRRPSAEISQFETATRGSTFTSGSGLAGRVWATVTPAYIFDVARDSQFDRAEVAAGEGLRGAFAFPVVRGSSEVIGVFEFLSRDVWQSDEDLLDIMASVGRQIGQFKERAAALNELQLRVNMLQHIPVAAWSVRPDGSTDIVNRLWFEYTGQTPEYVHSHPEAWMATLHPEDRETAARIYWDGIRSGNGFTMEARFRRASDGTYRWHLNRAVAVRDSGGNILRFVGTSTDVHDLRQVQEELRSTQVEFARVTRIMTMGELTASIAHEVSQPLGAIVTSAGSCARWLASKPPQMEKARRALERIANDGRRAGAIIQRIRALMKRQTPRKGWLDVNETIREVIALAQYELRRNDIVLETRLGEGLPRIRGDRVQCQQVLLNLIINSIEAMSEIRKRRRELTIVSATDGPDGVGIEVRDSGPGLDPERTTHLFEPFYTTKSEGLGIGLSISRSIVEAHGGRLWAGANTPHGAVFCIWLPVEEEQMR